MYRSKILIHVKKNGAKQKSKITNKLQVSVKWPIKKTTTASVWKKKKEHVLSLKTTESLVFTGLHSGFKTKTKFLRSSKYVRRPMNITPIYNKYIKNMFVEYNKPTHCALAGVDK